MDRSFVCTDTAKGSLPFYINLTVWTRGLVIVSRRKYWVYPLNGRLGSAFSLAWCVRSLRPYNEVQTLIWSDERTLQGAATGSVWSSGTLTGNGMVMSNGHTHTHTYTERSYGFLIIQPLPLNIRLRRKSPTKDQLLLYCVLSPQIMVWLKKVQMFLWNRKDFLSAKDTAVLIYHFVKMCPSAKHQELHPGVLWVWTNNRLLFWQLLYLSLHSFCFHWCQYLTCFFFFFRVFPYGVAAFDDMQKDKRKKEKTKTGREMKRRGKHASEGANTFWCTLSPFSATCKSTWHVPTESPLCDVSRVNLEASRKKKREREEKKYTQGI